MNLAFDLDGVITSQFEAIQIQAKKMFGITVEPEMITTYSLTRSGIMTALQELELWSNPDTYRLMPLVEGAKNALDILSHAKGHTIYILSARSGTLWSVTKEYLNEMEVPWNYIQLNVLDKARWMEDRKIAHPIDMFVDDNADIVRKCRSQVREARLMDIGLPYTSKIRGVKKFQSWNEIIERTREIEE